MTTVQQSDRHELVVPKLRQPLLKLAMSVAGFLIGLVLVEIVLRVVGFSYPSFWTLDAERGWAARPGVKGRYTKEGNTYVRMNREGFRDDDHERKKPQRTIRIAVLGDSFVEALQVPLESTFWKVLEKEIRTCSSFLGQDVEVLGFGGSGYSTAQERITYRAFARQYDPDIVVLAFFLGNDVSDNFRPLDYVNHRPYYVYDGSQLTLDQSYRDQVELRLSNLRREHLVSLIDRIRLLQLLKEAHHFSQQLMDRNRRISPRLGLSTESLVFVPPQDADWEEAWRITEGILTAFRDDVEEDGADFWLVAIPTPEQVHPEKSPRDTFMEGLGVSSLSYPEMRLQSWAEKKTVPFVGLSDGLSQYAERRGESLHGFGNRQGLGHWNEHGHRLAGRIVAQRICEVYAEQNR